MDVVASPGYRLSEYPRVENQCLMLHVTIANYFTTPSVLDASVDFAGSALAKVLSWKHRFYRGELFNVSKLVPLMFPSLAE